MTTRTNDAQILPPGGTSNTPEPARRSGRAAWLGRRPLIVAAIVAPLAFVAGGLSLAQTRPAVMAATPIPVAQLAPSAAVSARGHVAEIFGNKFVLQDESGRALVELGRRGEGGRLVAAGESVTVQGRFENGFLKASALIRADGGVETLGPAGGPPPGSLDWAKSKVGFGASPDMPAITAALQGAGFSDVRILGTGPRHVDVAAKDASGREHQLHVGLDGRIERDRPFG